MALIQWLNPWQNHPIPQPGDGDPTLEPWPQAWTKAFCAAQFNIPRCIPWMVNDWGKLSHYLVGGFSMFQPLWKITVCQLGWWFPLYGKMKNVPNHQLVIITVNRSMWIFWKTFWWMLNHECESDWIRPCWVLQVLELEFLTNTIGTERIRTMVVGRSRMHIGCISYHIQ